MELKYLTEFDENSYKIHCDCRDPYCSAYIDIEPVFDTSYRSLCFYCKFKPSNALSFWSRIKMAIKLILNQHCSFFHEILLNKENAKALRYVLDKFLQSSEGGQN